MKCVRSVLACLCILLFVACLRLDATAASTGFSTDPLPENTVESFLENVDISVIKSVPKKRPIQCFSVNEDGLIAVGSKSHGEKAIFIYTSDGVYLNGYTFNCSGSFGIELYKEHFNIYFVRSYFVVSVAFDGTVLEVRKVPDTVANRSHRNDLLTTTARYVGDTEYSIRNSMGILNFLAPPYSQVVVKDSHGAERIIYDVNKVQLTKTIVIIIGISIFVAAVVAGVVKEFIKLRHSRRGKGNGS